MSNQKWGIQNIPDQKGETIIITGASSGLGKEASKVLASKNANVIMAVRNAQKAEAVASEIRNQFPNANLDIRSLDLSSLDSVKLFAKGILTDYQKLNILINNAGVMMCPFAQTNDGFEIQMGTNHLGHFALAGLLMPLLNRTKNSRIVTTSSVGHTQGNIDFDDLNWVKRDYNTTQAYGDSKLANLYFTYELTRRLKNEPNSPLVIAAHPGYTSTNLQQHSLFWKILNPILAQKVDQGTLPLLRAAIDPESRSGDYYGPSGWKEMKGPPIKVKSNKMSYNQKNAKLLWNLSEQLTDIKY